MHPPVPLHTPDGMLMKILPGADRKRSPGLYCYRVTYRNPEGADPGCVMTWEVSGGRGPYQIALERLAPGRMKWHCTCTTPSTAASRTRTTSAST